MNAPLEPADEYGETETKVDQESRPTADGESSTGGAARQDGSLLRSAAAQLVPPWVRRKRARRKAGIAPATAPRRSVATDASLGATGTGVATVARQIVVRDVGEAPPRWWKFLGWDAVAEPTVLSSTRQGEAVNPLLVATHPPLAGPPDGIDTSTKNMLSLDPHLLYEADRITSGHWVVLGVLGSGKTSYVMTKYVIRQVAMGKQVAVFDRKPIQEDGTEGKGEYGDAADVCAGETIRFSRHGGHAINLLDPNITLRSDKHSGVVGQDALLTLAAEYAHGPLNSYEGAALRAAHRQALRTAKGQERVATIHDVIDALFDPEEESIPHESLARRGLVDTNKVVEWGMALALDLQRLVEGDLAGLVDADTSDEIDWDADLLVFDTSDIPENSLALSLVMMLVSTFLTNVWAAKGQRRRVIVLEEGYHAKDLAGAGGMTVAGLLKSLVKRGRAFGLSFGIVIHHISDIPRSSDSVTLIQEAGLIHIYRQDKTEDINDIVTTYGFPPEVADALRHLPQGVQIVRVGNEAPRMMQHIRSDLEVALTDSDSAMEGRAKLTRAAPAAPPAGEVA